MNCRRLPAIVTLAALTAVAPTASASFPVGVWGLVEKVTLDNPDKPTTMRIDGVFMVANQPPDFPQYPGYSAPQYGFINYVCLDKQLATCEVEWKELQALAGSDDNCRGWGDNTFEVNGTVKPPGEPSEEHDVYPVSMGVVVGFTPCQALAMWQTENPDPDTDGSTGEPGSTGSGDTGGESGTASSSGEPTTTSGEPATTGGAETGNVTSSGGTAEPFTSGAPTESGATGSAGTTGPAGTSTGAGETTAGDGGQIKDSGCACDGGGGDPVQHTLGAVALLAGLALTRRRRAA